MKEFKYKIGDIVNGNNSLQYCNPEAEFSNIESCNCHYNRQFTIKKRVYSNTNNKNWYLPENEGNWVCEDNLILVKESPIQEEKWIVGKWYKRDTGSFVKFSHLNGNVFNATESILSPSFEHSYTSGSYGSIEETKNTYTLTDIVEIQQYLPDNHPDKIPSSNIHPELIKDHYYLINVYNPPVEYYIQFKEKHSDGEISGEFRGNSKWSHSIGRFNNVKIIKEVSEFEARGIINNNTSIETNFKETFAILLNSQEELEACKEHFNKLGYEESSTCKRVYSSNNHYFAVYPNNKPNKLYQNIGNCGYPLKTLSELGIIVNKKEEDLLSIAKVKYPLNCKYRAIGGGEYTSDGNPRFIKQGHNGCSGEINIAVSFENNLKGLVYKDGEWAEIIKSPVKQEISKEIPEYVECYESDYKDHKRIYKVDIQNSKVDYLCLPELQKLRGYSPTDYLFKINGGVWKFKPSTFMAYHEQETIKQLYTDAKQLEKLYDTKLMKEVHPYVAGIDTYKTSDDSVLAFEMALQAQSNTIEVGDEVELLTDYDKYNNQSGKQKGFRFIIQEIKNGFYRHTEGRCCGVTKEHLKLVKKANTITNTYKQVDNSLPQITIGNTAIDIVAPKSSNSVTLGKIQEEVKINIIKQKTIKI